MNNPSTLIFLGLAVVWAIVLVPEGLKKLSSVRRSDSIRSFNKQLSVLDRSGSTNRGIARGTVGRSIPTLPGSTRGGQPSNTARLRLRTSADTNIIDLRDRRPVGANAQQSAARRQAGSPNRSNRPTPPVPSMAARRRRQEITAALAAAAVVSLLCVVAFGSAFLVIHLIADALLVGYLFLVNQANRNAQTMQLSPVARRANPYGGTSVTRISASSMRPAESMVGPRSANGGF